MSVTRKNDGERADIWLPTDSNWNLAVFLTFLGTVLMVIVPRLLDISNHDEPPWDYSAPLGIVLVSVGLLLWRFSRKRYRVGPREVVVHDGLRAPVRYQWEGEPSIRLRAQEEERAGKSVEYWLVNLVDGKKQYVLDRRADQQMESRCLAEALAKAINCSVIERSDEGEMVVKREELDLPFRDRARLHPTLLGPEMPKPENCTIAHTEGGGKLHYYWRLMSPGMLSELMTLLFVIVLLALVPIFSAPPSLDHPDQAPDRFERSYLDLARQEHTYTYFEVTGALLALSSFFLFGYRKELTAAPEGLSACDRLWGVPIWKASIPVDKLEEVWVRQSSRGAHLQFISDDCIISGRTSSIGMASWVASRIRRFYAA